MAPAGHLVLTFGLLTSMIRPSWQTSDDVLKDLDKPVPVVSAAGVLGQRADLPCEIASKSSEDMVRMVLWFKEGDGEPIFSADLRNMSNQKIWSSPNVFNDRASFKMAPFGRLVVKSVSMGDESMYRCRVDFKNSPTKNIKINFTVIVPPERPEIFDFRNKDKQHRKIEAFNEGQELRLLCQVIGGRPRPKVVWFLESQLIEGRTEILDNMVKNIITINPVSRYQLHSRLACNASNTHLITASIRQITLDVNLKPLSVDVITKDERAYLSAEKTYRIECRVKGSRPAPVITWYKNSNLLIKHPVKMSTSSSDPNVTISYVPFKPGADDNNSKLTCRAENPMVANSSMEDTWILNVHYVPRVRINFGSSLNPTDIKEGDDVYFECEVNSNPRAHRLVWFHNDKEIHHNVTGGVILINISLVLQKVTRQSAGEYSCMAINTEGRGVSQPINLAVRFVPICKSDKDQTFGALKQETVSLRCEVDSNPAPQTFYWQFNSAGVNQDLPSSRAISFDTVSIYNYTPQHDMEYGSIDCYAENHIGKQVMPCRYTIVAAGRPFPLQNCTSNHTDSSLQVSCVENFDGGLPQVFLMELVELPTYVTKFNISVNQTPPEFKIFGIEAGTTYEIRLYAVNAKGKSDPVILETVTFKGVAKYSSASSELRMDSVITALATLTFCTVILVIVIGLIIHRRRRRKYLNEKPKLHLHQDGDDATSANGALLNLSGNSSPHPLVRPSALTAEDSDPDIIPNHFGKRSMKGIENELFKTLSKTTRRKENGVDNTMTSAEDSDELEPMLISVDSPIQKLKGPEVVTALHRMQESCI
uniref:Titin n=1 Tax=Cacopsylla melanoneura TaxID=428564 RepID=A0A8D8QCP0_9HEMI